MNATQYLEHWKKNKVWTHLQWPKHQRRFELCASYIQGETFIDVGCAFGHSTAALAKLCPGKWAGLDFTVEAIVRARGLFPNMEFLFSPDYDMNLACKGRRFDSVVCSEVIEHVQDDAEFMRQLIRISGKRIVITTPNRRVSDPGHLRCYTTRTLEQLLAGTNNEIFSDGPFFYAVVKIGA